jgi:hypothetical protein
VPEDDDQASVDLLEGFERQVRNGLAALQCVVEFRKRGRRDRLILDVEDEPARDQGRVVPLSVEHAGLRVAIDAQPIRARLLGNQPRLARRPERVDKVAERYLSGGMKIGHDPP